jgi:glucose/arabinose dehydrogenase
MAGFRIEEAGFFVIAITVLGTSCGDGTSDPSSSPPTAVIESPETDATYAGGESVAYEGMGRDGSGSAIPADRTTWWSEFHHDDHVHPFLAETPGLTGSLAIPAEGETDPDVFYRLYLRVEDESGRADTTHVDILPRKSTLTITTSPAGLEVTLDGQPRPTPLVVEGVVGIRRTLGVVSPQSVGDTEYGFAEWSDDGDAEHVVVTPENDSAFVATFTHGGSANEPPTVSITAPAGGASVQLGQSLTIRANAQDPDGSVVAVSFYEGTTLIGTDESSPFERTWEPAEAGTLTLSARATDDDGATANSTTVPVSVLDGGGSDTQPPTLTLTAPADSTTGLSSLTIRANAQDNLAVAAVEFELDGTPLPEDASAPYERPVGSLSAFTSGQHVVRARARDVAGNHSAWKQATVTFGGNVALPQGFSLTTLVPNLSANVTAFGFAPDGRIFLALQDGAIRILKNGALLATPFTTVNAQRQGERGLIGLTLHPNFASNHWVYVHYTTAEGGAHPRISRFTANGDVASGETVLVDLPPLFSSNNHNGGGLAFGPDGKLYVALGDNNQPTYAQGLTSVLGKVLRFNPDGTIPSDNPYYSSTTGVYRSIWARGLRNPFTLAFDPAGSHFFINDVGQGAWEEINQGSRGANYGWPSSEGPVNQAGITGPRFVYPHDGSFVAGQAIVGASFYRPATAAFGAEYIGDFFFADYVQGWIARLDPAHGDAVSIFARGLGYVSALGVGRDGYLYIGARVDGDQRVLMRIRR